MNLYKKMGKLKSKIALITGASNRIGSAVAKRFVKEGAYVILASRSIDNLKFLYSEIEKLKEFKEGYVKLIQLDLLDFENIKIITNIIESLKLSEFALIDILVACTGILGKLNTVHDCELEDLQYIINTNFTVNWFLLKNLDPMLKKSNSGRVIFITSEVTLSPFSYPYWMPYIISKTAIEIMVKIYSSETKHTNLCVNAVCPEKSIDNEIYKKAFLENEEYKLKLPEKLIDKFVELSSENCNISGQILPLH